VTTVDTENRRQGLKVMDEVYGAGFADTLPSEYTPVFEKTVEHLFGEIWNRPGLSVRDRRLLVIGATAALGRADLIEIQVRGALANRELSAEELREAVLHLQYYVGWGNGTQVNNGVEAALRAHEKDAHEKEEKR
jgi:4-carboxymuconolactone decarboxylase